jgi:proteic killer suppression protein
MIKTFRHKGLRKLFETGRVRSVAPDLTRRPLRLLDYLNRATGAVDMNLPGNRLHELKGERKGVWSVMVGGNWSLTFTFQGEDAHDVDLEDYH